MGGRRLIRRTLAALAALVVVGGLGAVVWAASSDEDEPVQAIAGTGETGAEIDGGAPAEQPAPPEDEPAPPAAEPPAAEPPATEAPPPPTTETIPAPEPAPAAPEPTRIPRERRQDPDRRGKRFVVPPAREFTGTGNALLGTVVVRQPVVVRWRARGSFGLEFGREAFPIVAPSRSGQLVVPPFRFELVRVLASGRWTITVTPQG